MRYKTIKALPNIPIGTEFEYQQDSSPFDKSPVVKNPGNSLLRQNGLLQFIEGFGIDNDFFELVKVDYKKPRYQKYYYVDGTGDVCNTFDSKLIRDNFCYTTGNYFENYEAKQYRDYLLALGRINHRIHEMNEGWIPEWNSSFIYKCIAILPSERGEWSAANYGNRIMMSIFTYAKSENILKTLFVEMANDFEIVRVWMVR